MTDPNPLLVKLRDFLHTPEPDEDERMEVFALLQANRGHRALWAPLFEHHPRWSQAPLVWAHIDGMDGGMVRDFNPPTVSISAYAEVFPEGPIKLALKGGMSPYRCEPKAPAAALVQRCVRIRIDAPGWNYDGGQYGGGEGTVAIQALLRAAVACLGDHLSGLRAFEFKAAKEGWMSVWGDEEEDDDGAPSHVQTTLRPEAPGDFAHLRALVHDRALEAFAFSNHEHLSCEAEFGCHWLPESPWWPSLKQLDLSHNRIHPGDLGWLFHTPMPALERLDLSHNALGDEGAQALVVPGRFPALKQLDVSHNNVSGTTAERLKLHLGGVVLVV